MPPGPTPKIENHPFSAVRDYLLNIFEDAFHVRRSSAPSATRGRAICLWRT